MILFGVWVIGINLAAAANHARPSGSVGWVAVHMFIVGLVLMDIIRDSRAWETEIPHFRQLASEYQYDFDMAKAEYLKAIREKKNDK